MGVVVVGSAFFVCLPMTLAGLVRNRDRLMGIGQADLRIDTLGDDPGAPGARGPSVDPPVEDQRDRLRSAHVEVIADELFEERPAGRRTVKHPGIGDLELAKRQLVTVTRTQILAG